MTWQTVKLGELARVRTGKLDANAADENGLYPFFTCAVEPLSINTPAFDCKAILVAGNGDLNVKYYEGKFNAYQRTYVIESLDEKILLPRYLYLFLNEYVNELRALAIGGVIKYIKLANLTDALIPLPPLAEQQRIASILDKAELVKRKRELAIEKLDLLAESIFLEIYKKSNNTLEVALDTVLVGVKNCNPTSLFGKSSFTYIDIGAVNNLSKAIVSPQVINGIDAPSRARQVILEGDVLISTVRPNLNCVALVDEDYINPVASTGFCVLRCDHEKILPEFLFLLVRSKKFIQNLVNQATGASYPAVSDKIIKASKLNLPSIELQKEFEKKIKKISNQKLKLKNQNRKLNEFLDSLQSQAFSGQQ